MIICECRDGCQCQDNPGPAMHIIERNGKVMNVCSRCDLTGDTMIKRFALNRETLSAEALIEYDPIAALMVMMGEFDEPTVH